MEAMAKKTAIQSREQGNAFFQAGQLAFAAGVHAPAVFNFNHAEQRYENALTMSSKDVQEEPSCLKNLGVCRARLSSIVRLNPGASGINSELDAQTIALKALANLKEAHRLGTKAKSGAWLQGVESEMLSVYQDVREHILDTYAQANQDRDGDDIITLLKLREAKVAGLRLLARCCPDTKAFGIWYDIAEVEFQLAVSAKKRQSKRRNLFEHSEIGVPGVSMTSSFEDCEEMIRHLENAYQAHRTAASFKRYADDADDHDPDECLNYQEESLEIEFRYAETLRFLQQGQRILQDAVYESEELNWEYVWDSIDSLREAIKRSKEHNVELEAEACCFMGVIYWRCLKMRDRAKPYLQRGVQLGLSLAPKDVSAEIWFRRAREDMQELQQMFEKDEATKLEEERNEHKEYLDTVLPQIKQLGDRALQNLQKSCELDAFLEHIYENHLPDRRTLSKINKADKPKKKIMEAMRIWHTDHNQASLDHEARKFYFVCESISKVLSALLMEHKGDP